MAERALLLTLGFPTQPATLELQILAGASMVLNASSKLFRKMWNTPEDNLTLLHNICPFI